MYSGKTLQDNWRFDRVREISAEAKSLTLWVKFLKLTAKFLPSDNDTLMDRRRSGCNQ